jgi:hypothetical protein
LLSRLFVAMASSPSRHKVTRRLHVRRYRMPMPDTARAFDEARMSRPADPIRAARHQRRTLARLMNITTTSERRTAVAQFDRVVVPDTRLRDGPQIAEEFVAAVRRVLDEGRTMGAVSREMALRTQKPWERGFWVLGLNFSAYWPPFTASLSALFRRFFTCDIVL